MNKKIVIFGVLLVDGILAIVGVSLMTGVFKAEKQKKTSAAVATKGKMVGVVDGWYGYEVVRSKHQTRLMRRAGWNYIVVDDGGTDYKERFRRLDKGDYDFAVATIDSTMINHINEYYPGAMLIVVDVSEGGDATVAWKDKIQSLDDFKKNVDFKIAFTPNSPSHHVLKGVAVHFGIDKLRDKKGKWRVEADGSAEALKMLLNRKVDAAVLWEPHVTRALKNDKIHKLIGTEKMRRYVVDVLLFNRDYILDKPAAVSEFLSNYFRALKHYKDNRAELIAEIKTREPDLDEKEIKTALAGFRWVNMTENAQKWLGIARQGEMPEFGLINAIDSTIAVLSKYDKGFESYLTDDDPRILIEPKFIKQLYTGGMKQQQLGVTGTVFGTQAQISPLAKKFTPLDEAGWASLKPVGTLKPILFQSGNTELTKADKLKLNEVAEDLETYEDFRLIIKGHTAPARRKSGEAANKALSLARAEEVGKYYQITWGVDKNRMQVVGVGSDEPLPLKIGERKGSRAHKTRLRRVELFLVSEEY